MSRVRLHVAIEPLQLATPFRISGHVFSSHDVVVVTLVKGSYAGRGEASGVYYLSEDAAVMVATIEKVRAAIEDGADRVALQSLLPPCGARNALDCAMWELEAAEAGKPVWELAGLSAPRPLETTFTLGADTPEKMAEGARNYSHAKRIKVKLTGDAEDDIGRIEAIRAARPEVWLAVDANQGFTRDTIKLVMQALTACGVSLLEQPFARGDEGALDGFDSPIPVAADESALSLADIDGLVGRFDIVNIKLDKCGGLTEGLAMARAARARDLGVMVGNMVGTSLAMAPAYVLGQLCEVVDLDGPIFLTEDRKPSIRYADGLVTCDDNIWGSGKPVQP
ncbi:dipeptide epimerase [Parasphingorhabdus sp.]|uniref:dipeptide epimerase n=1 Tax=Parasphingorhabdus sp. TaxID=2709688 RepID=UPI0030024298